MNPARSVNTSRVARYGFAILSTGVALLFTHSIRRFATNSFFDLFQAAVVLSAWYGGFGPGALASGLSVLVLDYFFIPPLHAFELGPADVFRLVIFGAVALLTSSLSARLKEAKSDLERSYDQLERRVQERTVELSRTNTHLTDEIEQRRRAEKAILEVSNREQRRLGEDLHDGLCQMLAGLRLLSEQVKKQLSAKSAPEAKDVELIDAGLGDALAQADSLARGLYPVELETHGLMSALQELVDKIPKIYPVVCRFTCQQPVLIHDSTVATHLYRIAQEAVINAIKGGKAKRVTLRLRLRGSHVVLSIADNGIGFGKGQPRQGMGLQMMNNRARMINATLKFHRLPSRGTMVLCAFQSEQKKETLLYGTA